MNPLKKAHSVLGEDMISPVEMEKAFGSAYDENQIAAFTQTVPTDPLLTWMQLNGFALVPGPPTPMNLLRIEDLRQEFFYVNRGGNLGKKREKRGRLPGWYRENYDVRGEEKFSRQDIVTTGWLALRKKIIPGTVEKEWEEMQFYVPPSERVLNVAEVVWAANAFQVLRRAHLLTRMYTLTSSVALSGRQICAGWVSNQGIIILDVPGRTGRRDKGSRVGLITGLKL